MPVPELYGIALGLFMALGIFAFKTAVGNYYYLALPGRKSGKIFFLILMQVVYLVLFLLAFAILKRFNVFRITDISAFLKNGAVFHLLLCGGLIWWGARLLARPDCGCPDGALSHGWLLLTVPCPVCASAILLVCAFALMLFPDAAETLKWFTALFFLLGNLVFLGLLALLGKIIRIRPLELTGRLMILIGLYFILILLIAPRFQDAGRLYAAACASGGEGIFSGRELIAAGIAAAAALGGFCWNFLRKQRS